MERERERERERQRQRERERDRESLLERLGFLKMHHISNRAFMA